MKQLSLLLTLILWIGFNFSSTASPYLPGKSEKTETKKELKKRQKLERKIDKRIKKQIRKKERKQKRAQKMLDRLQKRVNKWKKKKAKKRFFGGVSDSSNFRIGLVLLLGGLAAVLIGSIISFGLLNWLGGLTALVGLGFIIWALVEYSS